MNNKVFASKKSTIRTSSLPQLTLRAAEVLTGIPEEAHMRVLQARLPSSCEANPFKIKKCKLAGFELRIESSMCALLETQHHPPSIPIQDVNQVWGYIPRVSTWWSPCPRTVDSPGNWDILLRHVWHYVSLIAIIATETFQTLLTALPVTP